MFVMAKSNLVRRGIARQRFFVAGKLAMQKPKAVAGQVSFRQLLRETEKDIAAADALLKWGNARRELMAKNALLSKTKKQIGQEIASARTTRAGLLKLLRTKPRTSAEAGEFADRMHELRTQLRSHVSRLNTLATTHHGLMKPRGRVLQALPEGECRLARL